MKKILILNTGGTFSKIYNPITGNLEIPTNNHHIETILDTSKISHTSIHGILYKDSLDMNKKDREAIFRFIEDSSFEHIIIIHGTDTIDKTASYLTKRIQNKSIVLTGAMQPFSIEPIEATANLLSSYGFLQASKKKGVFICMHGLIGSYKKIKKNRSLGIFQWQ